MGWAAGLALLLALPARAEPEPEPWVPPELPPPSAEDARGLVSELVTKVRDGAATSDWLASRVRAPTHPAPATEAWLATWAERLQPGAPLGERVAASPGPLAVLPGPAYQRVLLESPPGLSAVVVDQGDGAQLRELAWTTCALCTEPQRFVADLLDDVARRGTSAHRLLPGVELDLTAHQARHGVDSDWVGTLSLRNGQGGHLARVLRGARVVGQDDEIVRVRYADGAVDTWAIAWTEGRWQVDYARLAEDSPLRLSRGEERVWRDADVRAVTAREAWKPRFVPMGNESGLEIGHGAVDAWPDPLDGTVLVVVLEPDRVLTAVFRVDPETHQVLERIRAPLADARSQLPLDAWHWPAALSRDGQHLALTGPNRLWRLDLATSQRQLVSRGDVTWLGYTPGPDDELWAARGRTLLRVGSDGTEQRERHEAPVVGIADDAGTRWRVLESGSRVDASGEAAGPPVCCGHIVETAQGMEGTLAVCGPECDTAAVWLAPGRVEAVAGAGTDAPGASCSPDGRWFTTGREDGLLLWGGEPARPVARVPSGRARAARFTPDGRHLLTVGEDGRIGWWSLDALLARHGLGE